MKLKSVFKARDFHMYFYACDMWYANSIKNACENHMF
jgi:hypothetical protein